MRDSMGDSIRSTDKLIKRAIHIRDHNGNCGPWDCAGCPVLGGGCTSDKSYKQAVEFLEQYPPEKLLEYLI